MAVTAHEYVGMLKELLPPGPAWPRGDSTSLYAMMFEGWGTELARIDSRANALIKEADPRFAIETFPDWLVEWGLPDECLKLWGATDMPTLRRLLLWKMTTVGAQNKQFFIDLAAMFGYSIVIDEFFQYNVMSHVNDVLAGESWPHTWRVNVLGGSNNTLQWHLVTGEVKEPLAWWGDSVLECLIRRYAPAHTKLYFGYWNQESLENGQSLRS